MTKDEFIDRTKKVVEEINESLKTTPNQLNVIRFVQDSHRRFYPIEYDAKKWQYFFDKTRIDECFEFAKSDKGQKLGLLKIN